MFIETLRNICEVYFNKDMNNKPTMPNDVLNVAEGINRPCILQTIIIYITYQTFTNVIVHLKNGQKIFTTCIRLAHGFRN